MKSRKDTQNEALLALLKKVAEDYDKLHKAGYTELEIPEIISLDRPEELTTELGQLCAHRKTFACRFNPWQASELLKAWSETRPEAFESKLQAKIKKGAQNIDFDAYSQLLDKAGLVSEEQKEERLKTLLADAQHNLSEALTFGTEKQQKLWSNEVEALEIKLGDREKVYKNFMYEGVDLRVVKRSGAYKVLNPSGLIVPFSLAGNVYAFTIAEAKKLAVDFLNEMAKKTDVLKELRK
jgi:dsDNA-binding SOS-regulon protein